MGANHNPSNSDLETNQHSHLAHAVIPIDSVPTHPESQPVRSDLAQALDSAYTAVQAAAKVFLSRNKNKEACRMVLVGLALLAATDDKEWDNAYLHSSDEAAIGSFRACQAAYSSIELLLITQPDGENKVAGNAVLKMLRDAIQVQRLVGAR